MKNILLLSMGGTIASVSRGEGLEPVFAPDALLRHLPEIETLCHFDFLEVASLDSTNVQPEEWILLAERIFERMQTYDGFVVTHGTDTMAYTASALTWMLSGLQKPVILTGAQYPIHFPDTDAKENLWHAFLAATTSLQGVYIVFDHKIIQGHRASKLYSQNFSAFHSINAPLVGTIEDGQVLLSHPPLQKEAICQLLPFADTRVFVYKLIPGAEPNIVDMAVAAGYRGIVIEAYGAGGVPTYRRDFLPAISRATKAGVVVICATQCTFDGTRMDAYQVGVLAQRAGAIATQERTIEAVSTRLMWALAQTHTAEETKALLWSAGT